MSLIAVLLLAQLLSPAAARADAGSMTGAVNQVRAAVGKPGLRLNPQLSAVAQRWSDRMAAEQRMYHNPNLSREVTGWAGIAENVGYGPSEASVQDALTRSAGHYANMTGNYGDIGIGITYRGSTVWVAQVFVRWQPGYGYIPPPSPSVYQIPGRPELYRLVNNEPVYVDWAGWQAMGFPAPARRETAFVKYPWSPYVYSQTFWPTRQEWHWVTYEQWRSLGFPAVGHTKWVQGSVVAHKQAGSPVLVVKEPTGFTHDLTWAEWQFMGFPPPR